MLPEVRKALRNAADPIKAAAMQAYMKSTLPYHGVPTPLVRRICKNVFAHAKLETAAQWQAQVLDLWRNARLREERYAALHLAGDKPRPLSRREALKNLPP